MLKPTTIKTWLLGWRSRMTRAVPAQTADPIEDAIGIFDRVSCREQRQKTIQENEQYLVQPDERENWH